MNRRMILFTLGKMLKIESVLLLLPCIIGLIHQESMAIYYLMSAIVTFAVGSVMDHKKPKKTKIHAKEGFVIVAFGWIALSLFGAIPFYVSGEIPALIDAWFEMVSGFTTTGATILEDIEGLTYTSLFWRSFSHWIGGMGILVFVVAFLPESTGHTMHILNAEMPGPVKGKLVSKVKVTARILYKLYFAMTLLEAILLLFGGMPLFDSLVTALSTAGTGGFAIKNTSMAFYNSAYIDGVVTVFMILFGINFNILYFVIIEHYFKAFKSEELKWYLSIIAISTIAITINISHLYPSILSAFRYAVFQVSSIITTTGFITADYELWPMFSQVILMILIFVGASGGSTGGGIKVSRIMICIKSAFAGVKKLLHPHSVVSIEYEGKPLEDDIANNAFTYIVLYMMLFFASLLIISLQTIDFNAAFSAVATCINNVGPGMGILGPTGNFASLTPLSKFVLTFDMLAGRLEIFPVLMLFSTTLWKK